MFETIKKKKDVSGLFKCMFKIKIKKKKNKTKTDSAGLRIRTIIRGVGGREGGR